MYKIYIPHKHKQTDYTLCEDYEGELQDLFDKADIDEGQEVDVIYTMDSVTDKQLEIFRDELKKD